MPAAETPDAIDQLIAELYGDVDLTRATGVVHVASTTLHDGALHAIEIGPSSPKSDTDFFVLNLCRARADAIVVSGKILRDEPHLVYALGGFAATGLAAWRRERLGKTAPPELVVLTSGRDLDLQHPALHGWARAVIFTGPSADAELLRKAQMQKLPAHQSPAPSLRAAVGWLQQRGAATVSIEAGPSSVASLYDAPLAIDELLLSRYLEPERSRALRGGPFVREETLDARLRCTADAQRANELSGRWRFSRHVRRAPVEPGRDRADSDPSQF